MSSFARAGTTELLESWPGTRFLGVPGQPFTAKSAVDDCKCLSSTKRDALNSKTDHFPRGVGTTSANTRMTWTRMRGPSWCCRGVRAP